MSYGQQATNPYNMLLNCKDETKIDDLITEIGIPENEIEKRLNFLNGIMHITYYIDSQEFTVEEKYKLAKQAYVLHFWK